MRPASRLTARPSIRKAGLPHRRSPRRSGRSRPGMKPAAPCSEANEPGSRGPGLPASLPGNSVNYLACSLKKQWKRYRKELKRCQNKFSEKAIHAFRVETRRLLSTLELLGGFLPARRVERVQ